MPPPAVQSHLTPRDLLRVLVVVAIWGFAFVPMRWALDTVPPFALAALRFFLAAVPLVLFIPRPQVGWTTLCIYGFAVGVFQFGLLFLGMKLGMPAGLSSLVIQMQVFFTIGLAAWWLGDRLVRNNLIGAGIAATGIVILAARSLETGAGATFAGFLLVIAAAIAWAVANVVAKRAAARADLDMLGLVVWSSLAAPLPLAAASWLFEGGPTAWRAVAGMSALTLGSVLFMSYFATLFALARWNALLHRYPTAVIAPFALLVPVVGIVSGALLLGETLTLLQLAGVALVLAGLAYNVYGHRGARDVA